MFHWSSSFLDETRFDLLRDLSDLLVDELICDFLDDSTFFSEIASFEVCSMTSLSSGRFCSNSGLVKVLIEFLSFGNLVGEVNSSWMKSLESPASIILD